MLGPTVGAAVVLGVLALILWAVALWVSWGGECPEPSVQDGGLDKGAAVWPPAAQCVHPNGTTFWHQALPWATWAIGALVVAAAAILLTGLVAAIRDLWRPAPAIPQRSLAFLEASLPDRDPAGGAPASREEPASSEREPPAMAA